MSERLAAEAASTAGTQEHLKELWLLLLKEFMRYLSETPPGKLRVNRLEVIRAFLKDNNITIDGNHLADVQQSLSKLADLELPFDYQR